MDQKVTYSLKFINCVGKKILGYACSLIPFVNITIIGPMFISFQINKKKSNPKYNDLITSSMICYIFLLKQIFIFLGIQ